MWHMPPWKCFIHLAYCLRDSVVDLPHKFKPDWDRFKDVERYVFYELEDFERLALSLLDGVDMTASAERGRLLLECAVETGSTAVVEAVLNKGVDINGVDNDGRTALHTAMCGSCSEQVVELLLDRGADVNAKDKYGQTAINGAASLGMREQVAMLLTRGADLRLKTSNGRTVLHSAAGAGNYDVVQLLFDEGVIDYQNNDTDIIINSLAIRSKPIHINAQDKLGNTALHCAVESSTSNPYNGRYEKTIKLLLEHGADTWLKNQNNKTALQLAIARFKNGANVVYLFLHKEMRANNNDMIHKVCQLLRDTNDINRKNYEGNALLHIAVKNGHMDVVSILLQYGSDLGVVDRLGQTALHVAVKKGSGEMVRLLLLGNGLENCNIYTTPHYTYVNVKNNNGYTALHIAVQEGLTDIVSSLLNYGADIRMRSKNNKIVLCTAAVPNVNIQDNEGYTALHIAAVLGRRDIVSLLLEHGADKRVKTFTGVTVLHSAVKGRNVECLELIMKDGLKTHEKSASVSTLENTIDVNTQDDRGHTALHFSVISRNNDMIRTLIRLNADLSLQNNEGRTPLHIATSEAGLAEVNSLLHTLADSVLPPTRDFINIQNREGRTALHTAVIKRDCDMVRVLLKCWARFDIVDSEGNSALHKAVLLKSNNVQVTQLLLGESKTHNSSNNNVNDINVQDRNGNTVLHIASLGSTRNHKEVVTTLLDRGVDLGVKNKNGQTALQVAIKNIKQSIHLVYLLLREGTKTVTKNDRFTENRFHTIRNSCGINAQGGPGGETLLQIAVKDRDTAMVSSLLKFGACIDKKNRKGYTALHVAVFCNNIEIVKLLLLSMIVSSHKSDMAEGESHSLINDCGSINASDHEGKTSLHYATYVGQKDIVRLLLKYGADLKLKCKRGQTALHTAVSPRIFKESNAEIVKMMLEEFADIGNDNVADKARSFVNMQDSHGDTALHIVLDEYNTDHDSVKSLLCNGADLLHLKNKNGKTALQKALETGDLTAWRLMMNAGVDVNVADDEGQTLLMSAAKAGHLSVVAEILDAGADVAGRDQKGLTALHYAGSGYVVNHLLKHGADIDAQSEDGSTPLHYAIHCKRGGFVIEALFSLSYQFDKKDIMGKTAIDYWCENMQNPPEPTRPYMTNCGPKFRMFHLKEFNLKRTFGRFKAAGLLEHITERKFTLFNPAMDRELVEEIYEIKSTIVGDVCLYSVLNYQLTDLRFLANPEVITMIRSRSFSRKFINYHHLIKIRFLQAQELPALLDEVSEVFAHSLSNTLELNIPLEVCRMILVRTSHFDLKKMNAALKASED